jgi:hypothetical protein
MLKFGSLMPSIQKKWYQIITQLVIIIGFDSKQSLTPSQYLQELSIKWMRIRNKTLERMYVLNVHIRTVMALVIWEVKSYRFDKTRSTIHEGANPLAIDTDFICVISPKYLTYELLNMNGAKP